MIKFLLDIVSTPAILVALIAILGLVLQKKALPDIIKGGIKTFVGFSSCIRWCRNYSKFLESIRNKCLKKPSIYQELYQIMKRL